MEATLPRRHLLTRPAAHGLAVPIALSLAAHVLLFGAGILFYSLQPAAPRATKPIVAKLVRLGQERDPRLLPRRDVAPPLAAAGPATAPSAAPLPSALPPRPAHAPGKPAAPTPARPSLSREARMLQALARAQAGAQLDAPSPAAEEPEGAPDGHLQGDATAAEEGDRYLALVRRAVQQSYVLPTTISERDRLHLKATVVVYVHPTGKILRYVIETPSGNDIFDRALERAIRATTLPPPPPALAAQFREDGIGFIFQAQ